MKYNNGDYIMFMDAVGHTFLGVFVDQTDDYIQVKNPLIISSEEKRDTGGMNIQFFPILFREFQADKNQPTIWNVPKSTTMWMEQQQLEVRLTSQYERIFSPIKNVVPNMQPNMQSLTPQSPQSESPQSESTQPPVIKLFDN